MTVDAPHEPMMVRADAELMQQAVLNLLLNGMQAMPAGGGAIQVRMRREHQFAVVEVADDGEGIPVDLLPRIFELYFTTKPKGSGIGLAMTYRILQLHGGAMEVREPGFPWQACITRSGAPEREPPVPARPARVLAQRAGWLAIEAGGPGWLVTVQPWYPGWAAWVDGESVSVEALDGALVGVALSAGTHVVIMRYLPEGLQIGLLVSFASGVLLLAAWGASHNRAVLGWVYAALRPGRSPVEGRDVGGCSNPIGCEGEACCQRPANALRGHPKQIVCLFLRG